MSGRSNRRLTAELSVSWRRATAGGAIQERAHAQAPLNHFARGVLVARVPATVPGLPRRPGLRADLHHSKGHAMLARVHRRHRAGAGQDHPPRLDISDLASLRAYREVRWRYGGPALHAGLAESSARRPGDARWVRPTGGGWRPRWRCAPVDPTRCDALAVFECERLFPGPGDSLMPTVPRAR